MRWSDKPKDFLRSMMLLKSLHSKKSEEILKKATVLDEEYGIIISVAPEIVSFRLKLFNKNKEIIDVKCLSLDELYEEVNLLYKSLIEKHSFSADDIKFK